MLPKATSFWYLSQKKDPDLHMDLQPNVQEDPPTDLQADLQKDLPSWSSSQDVSTARFVSPPRTWNYKFSSGVVSRWYIKWKRGKNLWVKEAFTRLQEAFTRPQICDWWVIYQTWMCLQESTSLHDSSHHRSYIQGVDKMSACFGEWAMQEEQCSIHSLSCLQQFPGNTPGPGAPCPANGQSSYTLIPWKGNNLCEAEHC